MKKRTPDKFWFPWWPDKWIFGSVRIECTPAERGIWVDLLSLASKDDGFIRANEETPYPISQLAGMLIIPEETLSDAIEKFIELGKLVRTKEGTLCVAKWDKYQFSERHKRRVGEDEELEEEEDEFFYKSAIQCPNEFSEMANKNGTIRMNRLIVAIILDRSLKPEEEVHHINKKENDNKPENLMLFADHKDHGRYEHGYEVKPIWDGSKLSMTAKTAIIAKIKAAILKKNILDKKKEDKIKKYGEKFNKEWLKWPLVSRAKKKICRSKFIALCKSGKHEEYLDIRKSYFAYLRMQHQKTGFEQRPMHISTWLNNWEEEKERYKGIEYKPPL